MKEIEETEANLQEGRQETDQHVLFFPFQTQWCFSGISQMPREDSLSKEI